MEFLAEDVITTCECFIKWVVRISEAIKAILPQAHVLKLWVGSIEGLHPICTKIKLVIQGYVKGSYGLPAERYQ